MLNGCSIKAFEGWLSDLVRKNYQFDCIILYFAEIREKYFRTIS